MVLKCSTTIKNIKEINALYEKTYDLRKEIAEVKFSTDPDKNYISNLTSELEMAYDAIRKYAEGKGVGWFFTASVVSSETVFQK